MSGVNKSGHKQGLKFVKELRELLPVKESFDITERNLIIGGREAFCILP